MRTGIADIGAMTVADQLTPFVAKDRGLQHGDRMRLLSEMGRGTSMMSLLTASSVATFLVPPFGLMVGLSLGGLFAFKTWRELSRHGVINEFRVWMNEQITHAQLTINNGFALQAVDLQNAMKSAIRDTLSRRENQLSQSVESAQALQRQTADKQSQAREQLEHRIRSASALRAESARLLAALTPATVGE